MKPGLTAGLFNIQFQLMRWYDILNLNVSDHQLAAIQQAKLMHLVTSKMMDSLLREDFNKSWRVPFLKLVYDAFNAPDILKDTGSQSIVSIDFQSRLEAAVGGNQYADIRRFLGLFHAITPAMIERLQMVVFWALYTQKGHTMPKTFLANLRSREPLAILVLDPTAALPEGAVRENLLSIFCRTKRSDGIFMLHNDDAVPPFASPYGASVLYCGQQGCGVKFYSETDIGKEKMDCVIREGRAKHLKEAYQVDEAFASQTGLPERTTAPKAPTCHNNTLHISTARAWSRLDHAARDELMRAIERGTGEILDRFEAEARHEICAKSHRGNVYSATIEEEVRRILPSLLTALQAASWKAGLKDQSGLSFKHDWTQNTIVWKMNFEMGMLEKNV